ncbi:di-heme oxidoredictase family protein [Marinagarivorans cellulosilyticus]|uniref:Cytochrome c domain-containing protein n=1 Tax=Marinagarivorans cellulosilyticus TaxID=2721545 RepID=A0AAN2BJE6_9GAMM|nr:di-heme oxidoredictase family protein [Marinagarivorans cellulosilyticus]BCD96859.1 hypothetical protein MARGE09_P1059 [Marinagarivorans cellulosilyticus]
MAIVQAFQRCSSVLPISCFGVKTSLQRLLAFTLACALLSGCSGGVDVGVGIGVGQSSAGESSSFAVVSSSSMPVFSSSSASNSSAATVALKPLFGPDTVLEAPVKFDRGDALVTRFADRGRDRHAKENQFQAYDHFLTFYWEHRTAAIEIIDEVAKGGDTIRMNVLTQWRLDDTEAENRWFYRGLNTVAEYYDNGTMVRVDDFNYYKERTWNNRENRPLHIGDKIEFEMSQFLTDNLPRGRANYYGTTYLYIVGEGLVPWDIDGDTFVQGGGFHQKDSVKIPEQAWLGGETTLPYMHSGEPDNHFMQMATNLGFDNGQKFVLGRHVHHSSFVDGSHDENAENGIFDDVVGLAGGNAVNDRCTGCHKRNGRALPEAIGVPLDKWVFKVGDANGEPDPRIGAVLQPSLMGAPSGEGQVSIAAWHDVNGLRAPQYAFSEVEPAQFSARIAPQLVGMGLLEAIAESDILAWEDINDSDNDGISGKARIVADPVTGESRLGRFGWKAGASSITHQVAGALNTDMGVKTSVLPNLDCGSGQAPCPQSDNPLSDEHLQDLVKYIALLGVRPQRDVLNADVVAGKQWFMDAGCEKCHRASYTTSQYHPFAELQGQNIQPYTDMLVHDMGEGLADNLAEGNATGAEWRTTPLWGLGLSACVAGGVANPTGHQGDEVCTPAHSYLHDGRARSIEEAILWHGGEGEASKNHYQQLTPAQQQQMLRFLESL